MRKEEQNMKQVATFFKKLRLRQILTVFLVGVTLFVTTACNTGNTQGARPNNPPVQAGGQNNPYKGGGDNYTKYNQSTEAPVKGGLSDLQLISGQLIALNNESKSTNFGTDAAQEGLPEINVENANKPKPGGLIQREPNIGDRIEDRLETVKEAIQEATSFLGDKADEAADRPELQPNPTKK